MSYTETHFGKLRRVEIDNDVTIEQWEESKRESLGDKLFEEKYIVFMYTAYEFLEHTNLGEDDLDVFIENEDGTITFIVQFYNGGCGLGEVLEEGINNLNKNV